MPPTRRRSTASSTTAIPRGGIRPTTSTRPSTRPATSVDGQAIRPSLEQVAQFLLEPAQDARLGLADGGTAHAQFAAQRVGGALVDGRQPEGLPGRFLELAADLRQGLAIDPFHLRLFVLVF